MPTYQVECDVGTLYATVEATDEDDAMSAAMQKWDAEFMDYIGAGTFGVSEVEDAV